MLAAKSSTQQEQKKENDLGVVVSSLCVLKSVCVCTLFQA